MSKFVIKNITNSNIREEIINVGYDKNYACKAKEKFEFFNLKIFGITSPQGNILKQLALSAGCDCATNKDVITCKADTSDCILGGSLSQLSLISQKLKLQPFGLKDLGCEIEQVLDNLSVQKKTKIAGILNLTTNSFSDGGMFYKYDDAVKHLNELIEDGADIIDIGAESTKPYSSEIPAEEQLEKLLPVLDYINKNNIIIPISIDTRSSKVADECIKHGAAIINDVSGLTYDSEMANTLANYPEIKVIIQHSLGTPEDMQINPEYNCLTDDIFLELKKRTDYALSKGIKNKNIIIDPVIGFGKTKKHNIEIIKNWMDFKSLGYPVMIGVSRKSLLEMNDASNGEKDLYTLGLNGILINEGIDYIRVHNVKIHKKLINILTAV